MRVDLTLRQTGGGSPELGRPGSRRLVASVCSGTFILAVCLLDGCRATTHWSRSRLFARRYPKVRLEPERMFVPDGAVLSPAGITAGIDLALALIADDLGEAIARQTGQQFVLYRRRPGGQSQFSALLEIERPDGRFGPLLIWARERLRKPLTVERPAEPAQFRPAFRRGDWRHAFARHGAAAGRSGAAIAASTGFGDPERMRRVFLRAFGQPPQALRRSARVANG